MTPSATSPFYFATATPFAASRQVRLRDWLTFSTMVAFSAGLLTNLRFQFVGIASAGEVLLALVAVFSVLTNLSNPRFWSRSVVLVLAALCVSFGGYVLSDLINGTPTDRLIRGWARIGFVLIDFVAVWALVRNRIVNLFAICVGDSFSTLLSWSHHYSFLFNYKFHFSIPITVLVLIFTPLIFRRRPGMATGIAQIGVGMCHIWFDCRTGGAICVLTGFVLIARGITASRLRSLYLTLLALALILSSVAVSVLYSSTNPAFSDRRQGSNSLRLGMAMGGINAIERSPVVGLGSWVWDQQMWNTFVSFAGRTNMTGWSQGDSICAHSQILQSWSEAGLLGVVFFVYYGKLLGKALWTLFFRRIINSLTPLLLFYLLTAIWDLFFSPFANLHRFGIALALVIAIQILAQRRSGSVFLGQDIHMARSATSFRMGV